MRRGGDQAYLAHIRRVAQVVNYSFFHSQPLPALNPLASVKFLQCRQPFGQ